MIEVKEQKQTYATRFERIEAGVVEGGSASLLAIRKAAFSRFTELGFPTTKHEEWQYTNIAPIAEAEFERMETDTASGSIDDIAPFNFGACAATLVFMNGKFAPHLSAVGNLHEGIRARSLADALSSDDPLITRHLARHAKFDEHAFTALNTAMMEDGAFVYIPPGVVVEQPIHLIYLTSSAQPGSYHPRNLFVLGSSSQATLVESYAGLEGTRYFSNPVTEIVTEAGAVLDHYKIVRESDEAFHVSTLQLHQHQGSNASSTTVSMNGRLVRNDIRTLLDGDGCDCTLNGVQVIDGTQHVDNHLVVDHAKPNCNSREFFKNVLNGKSRGVFSGRIMVREDAQKTDAKQTNQSLLLSEDAQVDSKPQLEILADDVKCTHGATIGQLDEDAVFYLQSRGLDFETARSLLVYAFAREVIDEVRIDGLRNQLDELLIARLPQGQLLRERL